MQAFLTFSFFYNKVWKSPQKTQNLSVKIEVNMERKRERGGVRFICCSFFYNKVWEVPQKTKNLSAFLEAVLLIISKIQLCFKLEALSRPYLSYIKGLILKLCCRFSIFLLFCMLQYSPISF